MPCSGGQVKFYALLASYFTEAASPASIRPGRFYCDDLLCLLHRRPAGGSLGCAGSRAYRSFLRSASDLGRHRDASRHGNRGSSLIFLHESSRWSLGVACAFATISRRKFVMFLLPPFGIALSLFRRHTILRVAMPTPVLALPWYATADICGSATSRGR